MSKLIWIYTKNINIVYKQSINKNHHKAIYSYKQNISFVSLSTSAGVCFAARENKDLQFI